MRPDVAIFICEQSTYSRNKTTHVTAVRCGCWLLSNNLTGNTYQLNNFKKDRLKAHVIQKNNSV